MRRGVQTRFPTPATHGNWPTTRLLLLALLPLARPLEFTWEMFNWGTTNDGAEFISYGTTKEYYNETLAAQFGRNGTNRTSEEASFSADFWGANSSGTAAPRPAVLIQAAAGSREIDQGSDRRSARRRARQDGWTSSTSARHSI